MTILAAPEPGLLADDRETTVSVLVVGSGPVGMKLARHCLDFRPELSLTVCGNEPFAPYNRVQLSAFLAGELDRPALDLPVPDRCDHPNFDYRVATIASIDAAARLAVDRLGRRYAYETLVLATGARAHQPNIPGLEQTGVYTFRNLKDADHLYARTARARHVVVLGGGLLGLEAAHALRRASTRVTVIQQGAWLMNRQLDETAAARLRATVEARGIEVIVNSGVRRILGDGRVTGVRIQSGEDLACDTVLLCAGIQPNIELARNAGLKVGRGILVDDRLRTSDPHIYAVGECCEHRGRTYGLVAPGFEQAAVAADVLTGGAAEYRGSQYASRLKVVGESVRSLGEVTDLPRTPYLSTRTFHDPTDGAYRKVVVARGRLVGAVGIGDWPEFDRIQEAFQQGRRLRFWQTARFKRTGRLWSEGQADDPATWPAATLICQCSQVSRGQLTEAMSTCSGDLAELKRRTGAGTVCGSCQPVLEQLAGATGARRQEAGWRLALVSSGLALVLAALLAVWPAAPVADSVLAQGGFERLWNDKVWKQVTGFSVLGLSSLALVMSLRKRLRWSWLGSFVGWRGLHTSVGALCVALLMVHTGFHLGTRLNAWLMADFLAVVLLGAGAGSAVGMAHRLPPHRAVRWRRGWRWLHLVVSWPLPVLLAVHILSVYYF